MPYLEVTIKTASGGIQLTADALTAMGYDSLVLEDQQEYQEFLESNRACWDYIDDALARRLEGLSQIKLYLEQDETVSARLESIGAALRALRARRPGKDLGPLTVSAAPLDEEDWANSWKKHYPPQFVGEKLCVLPYWLPAEAAQGRLPVILDPGLTFGTGSHATTQLCLELLQRRPLHCRPAPGGRLRRGGGHRSQGRGYGPGERSLQRHGRAPFPRLHRQCGRRSWRSDGAAGRRRPL